MSSKNGETLARRRRWSLATRLTRHYVVSTAMLLAAGAALMLWTLERALDARDRSHVRSKLQVLQLLLREHYDKPQVIESEVEHESAEAHAITYYLRILDDSGRTLIETSGMKDVLPPSKFPEWVPPAVQRPGNDDVRMLEHAGFLLGVAQAETGGALGQRRVLHVALALTAHRELTAEYRRTLLTLLGLGIVIAGLAGRWIARRGMMPLAQISAVARKVSANQLSSGVSDQRWPDELAELAGAFDEMINRLEESFRRLSDFSVDMAHALRNPINNLRGEAEVALRKSRSLREYQQVLGSNLEELERLSRMIDGLLFIARADDAKVAVERSPLSARREIEAVIEFYKAVAEDSGIMVVGDGDADFDGDPMLVRRAISNLLGNALKHTSRGGRVTLRARPRERYIDIEVRDDGVGIPADQLPRVFDRFFQVDKSRDFTAKGSGLGLAIVRSIMRLHGGDALISSSPGDGTTVTLRFPVDSAKGHPDGASPQIAVSDVYPAAVRGNRS